MANTSFTAATTAPATQQSRLQEAATNWLIPAEAAPAPVAPVPAAPSAPAAPVVPAPASVPVISQVSAGQSQGMQLPDVGVPVVPQAQPSTVSKAFAKEINTRLGQTYSEEDTATNSLAALPAGIQKLYEPQLEDLRAEIKRVNGDYVRVQQANLEAFAKEKLLTQIASVAESLAFNVFRFSAGMRGLSTGRDIASGLAFNPTNWHAEIQGLREDLAAKQKMTKDSLDAQLAPLEEQRGSVTKSRDEDMRSRLEAVRERLANIRQDRRSLLQEKGQIELGAASSRERASATNTEIGARSAEGAKQRESNEQMAEDRGAARDAAAQAKAAEKAAADAKKDAEQAVAKKEKEDKAFQNALSKASSAGKSATWVDDRATVLSMLRKKAQAAGKPDAYVDELVKHANSADNWLLPDVGAPNSQVFKDKGRNILQQAYDALDAQASPSAETKLVGGKTYVKMPDGTWKPQ